MVPVQPCAVWALGWFLDVHGGKRVCKGCSDLPLFWFTIGMFSQKNSKDSLIYRSLLVTQGETHSEIVGLQKNHSHICALCMEYFDYTFTIKR